MRSASPDSALVTPDWLAEHRDDPGVCLIEIAGMGQEQLQAYRDGHVPGAHPWHWKQMLWDPVARDFPSPDTMAARLGAAGIGNDTTVVFYGEEVQFGIYAWWVLRYCGHRDVRVLDGARYRWRNQGRPLVREAPPARAAATYRPAARDETMRVLRDEVLRRLGDPRVALLDMRSPEEYRGERVSPPNVPDFGAERTGRIPGAAHLYYLELLEEDRSFRSPEALRAVLAERGVDASREVVAYCRLSHRATVLHFAMTQLLGMPRVRVYDGSWIEWGNLVGAPIEK